MRRLIGYLTPLLLVVAFARGTFGLKVEGPQWGYHLYVEQEVFTIAPVTIYQGVSLDNRRGLELYTGVSVQLDSLWLAVEVDDGLKQFRVFLQVSWEEIPWRSNSRDSDKP